MIWVIWLTGRLSNGDVKTGEEPEMHDALEAWMLYHDDARHHSNVMNFFYSSDLLTNFNCFIFISMPTVAETLLHVQDVLTTYTYHQRTIYSRHYK